MQVIDSLNTLLDPEQQLAWRSTHKTAFGNLVGTVALQQEQRALRSSSNVLFLDRSVLDNLGYARVRGYDPPAFLTEELVQSVVKRIGLVFVLEPPASNHAALEARNAETGRATDPAGSKHVSSVMHDVYSTLGCRTHWLADAPVDARLEVILDACGLTMPDEPACSDIHRALSTHLLGRATCDAYETGGDARPADAVAAPHTNLPSALLEAIFARLRPAFLVEVGSWKGEAARCESPTLPSRRARAARRRRACSASTRGSATAARGLSATRAGATACCSIAGCRSSSASFVKTRGGGATSSSRGRSRRSPHCARCSTWWSTATCRRPNSSTSIRRTRPARRCSRSRAPSTCCPTAACSWATTSTGPRWSATCGAFVRSEERRWCRRRTTMCSARCRTCTTSATTRFGRTTPARGGGRCASAAAGPSTSCAAPSTPTRSAPTACSTCR